MKNKNLVRGIFVLGAFALIGASVIAVQAASDNNFGARKDGSALDPARVELREERQAQMETNRTAAFAAIEAGDYSAWQEAVGDNNPFADKITADNFPRFIEAHNLRQAADSIMSELGVENGFGAGKGQGRGMHRGAGMGRNIR
jgi:hypothetical protein